MSHRTLSPIDRLIDGADRALRTLAGDNHSPRRETPAPAQAGTVELSDRERRHATGLMRVNHSGEVCAQALYQGQALAAKLPRVRDEMAQAADEEMDHLAWCEQRIRQLGGQPSYLNPLWYGLSFGLGAAAGTISDRLSLGFVAATEEQVCKHLEKHLTGLPEDDTASRAIVARMLADEARHADTARQAGGLNFPTPVKGLMSLASRLMTATSYRL